MLGKPALLRRWFGIIAFSAVLAAVVLLLFHFDEPVRRYFGGVKPGVHIQGELVESLFRPEVAEIVSRLARVEGREPVDAVLNDDRKEIIPELNGIKIDQEATVELIMEAERNAHLTPVYKNILPTVRWEHYPSLPVYQGNPRKPVVALAFAVTEESGQLLEILDLLEQKAVKSTFFVTGKWAENNENLLIEIYSRGHELGNHGFENGELSSDVDVWAVMQSIRRTNEIIFEGAGCYPLYFTPHQGEFNELILEVVSRQGMRTVLWSADTKDLEEKGVQYLSEKIMNHSSAGQIILLYPTADTIELLSNIIPFFKAKGLQLERMANLLDPGWPSGERRGAVAR